MMETATNVRREWRTHLNNAAARLPVAFSRGQDTFAVISQPLLQDLLRRSVPSPVVIAEDGGWSVFLDGFPVAGDGADFDEAIDEFLLALTDYISAWVDRLHDAPNHRHAAALAQLVTSSSEAELRVWAGGSSAAIAS